MAKTSTGDTIAILSPFDRVRGQRSRKQSTKIFGSTEAYDVGYDKHKWFQIERAVFHNIRAMDTVLVAIANDGHGIPVRGNALKYTGPCVRRIMAREGDDQAGIQAADLRMLCIDADGWPNLQGLDPRTDPEATWAWMLSVLGPEFARTTVSAWWSSSCCVRTSEFHGPMTLSAKFFFYMDRPLGQVEAVLLCKRADARVRTYIETVRTDPSDSSTYMSPYLEIPKDQKLVDHRVALTSQLIYIAPPKFLPGATDPFAGRVRQKLLTRKRQSLAVDAVLKSLPVLEHARTTKSRASRKTGAARMPKARSTSVHVRGQIVPMAAAAREIAAARKACAAAVSGTDEQYLEACCQLFQRRAALEMLALAAHRGGLSEGGRNDGALMIASAIAASLPFTTGSIQLRRQIRDMLKLVVSEEWIDSEWEGSGDLSVIGRFEEDALREAVTLKSGRRYAYSKPRLLDEWQPTQDEVDALGLMSLCSEKQRSASRRATAKAAKAPADTPWEAKVRILAPEAQRLQASGRSLRGIVSATGIPISTVRRLLAAVPAVRAAPVIAPVPVAQIELADGQIDAAVEMALVRGDDYADVLATQLGLTTDQVRGAALRLGQPELILPAGLALAA